MTKITAREYLASRAYIAYQRTISPFHPSDDSTNYEANWDGMNNSEKGAWINAISAVFREIGIQDIKEKK